MKRSLAAVLVLVSLALSAVPASAHRPYFEETDITADKPWSVSDPTISTAIYATLDTRSDADYYAFDGRKGQRILLSLTIPQIAGQEQFAPEMALLGPGLGAASLPARAACRIAWSTRRVKGSSSSQRWWATPSRSTSRSAALRTGSARRRSSPCLPTAAMSSRCGMPKARSGAIRL